MKKYFLSIVLVIVATVARAFCGSGETTTTTATKDSILPMERIFLKPYIIGSRPSGVEISPDEKYILYQWDEKGGNKARHRIMNADGTNDHVLPDTLVSQISWSPDL
ncbi:MAG TPA: hypothetical protein VKS81_00330, partial [Bacteroidota bacterium]|nr:hypothetical protein [Bacteroidota bacterium]